MLQDLLSKYTTEAERQSYLLQLVKEHPYFTPAHFCLLQSTPAEEVVYAQRAATTALLFNNTGWLNYQLNHHFKQTAAIVQPEIILPLVISATEQGNEVIAGEATIMPSGAEIPVEETFAAPQTEVASLAAETIPGETIVAAPVTEEIQPVTGNTNTNNIEVSTEMDKTTKPVPLPVPGNHDSELLFEPLYAVDYFASQGIKLSEDLQSGDKLGKQLKSFTEWLKSMKKTQAQTAEEPVLPASDPAIQYIAEKSNKEGEVVTEAMALVYAQQGNIKKAITIYQKLSLLNPPKSAYFAAKIENLK
jgi:hypothetical protein